MSRIRRKKKPTRTRTRTEALKELLQKAGWREAGGSLEATPTTDAIDWATLRLVHLESLTKELREQTTSQLETIHLLRQQLAVEQAEHREVQKRSGQMLERIRVLAERCETLRRIHQQWCAVDEEAGRVGAMGSPPPYDPPHRFMGMDTAQDNDATARTLREVYGESPASRQRR